MPHAHMYNNFTRESIIRVLFFLFFFFFRTQEEGWRGRGGLCTQRETNASDVTLCYLISFIPSFSFPKIWKIRKRNFPRFHRFKNFILFHQFLIDISIIEIPKFFISNNYDIWCWEAWSKNLFFLILFKKKKIKKCQ